jgi:hypothetical protein
MYRLDVPVGRVLRKAGPNRKQYAHTASNDRLKHGDLESPLRYTTQVFCSPCLRDNIVMPGKRVQPPAGPAPKLDRGKQLARVRKICLSLPGTIEKLSHGEPTFFTPKRVFAMFADNHHGDGHVAVWVPAAPGVQVALIEEAPATYFRPPYVGVAGWVGVELSKIDDAQLGALLREAFSLINAKVGRSVARSNQAKLR